MTSPKRPQIGLLQLQVLGTIDRLGSVELSSLKVILNENKQNVDEALRTLTKTGMVEREGKPYRYRLSGKGRIRLETIRRYVRPRHPNAPRAMSTSAPVRVPSS